MKKQMTLRERPERNGYQIGEFTDDSVSPLSMDSGQSLALRFGQVAAERHFGYELRVS